MNRRPNITQSLSTSITKKASKQTYYTIRLFVDRKLINDAYRAYGYFRWVDDILDEYEGSQSEKSAFVNRQKDLLEACYRGDDLQDLCIEEHMLVEMVRNDTGNNSGLRSYLHNMMAVMEFDAARCGREISQAELSEYTGALATAVTDAMYYFIGHDDPPPIHKARYLAITAAHITHMLRDTIEDIESGYFNIPTDYLQMHGISQNDFESEAYQLWVRNRVELARLYFKKGWKSLASSKNLRCRLVGFAYQARFEWILRSIEQDNYSLRSEYSERKSLIAALWMSWSILTSMIASIFIKPEKRKLVVRPIQVQDR